MKIISEVSRELEVHGIESAKVNAEVMLSSLLGCERVDLYAGDMTMPDTYSKHLNDMVSRRIAGEPLQYITGRSDFYGNEFLAEPGVFIPRPETEVLVEAVLDLLKTYDMRHTTYKTSILDLCTGTGNIAISLAKLLAHCKIVGSDISVKAVDLAMRNAKLHNVLSRVEFIRADLFDAPMIGRGLFDIIVSNPPYIAREGIRALPSDVKKEPQEALDGGRDGLYFYRRITEESPRFLKKGGILAFELGDDMCEEVEGLLTRSGSFKEIRIRKDLNNIERVITALRN
ncbi:MAG: peptide chain release factor N(5)-glutamine methyltransferase [Candidatus Omnitrophica bacterium]|nr:peptide chain release factor N(5)-glutamine methyltransferase [Candidatus Omnitrophota bacterium]